jgi:deoxycytidylate deaminase
MSKFELDWSKMAFGSKRPLRDLQSIFIAPSREVSQRRFAQIVKKYLPLGNIVVALPTESFIKGYEGQRQFRTIDAKIISPIIEKVNQAKPPHLIYTLKCAQTDFLPILREVKFARVILVNGSWQSSFHLRPEYHKLAHDKVDFDFVSPFADEEEAMDFDKQIGFSFVAIDRTLDEIEAMRLARSARVDSFDTSFQTGAALFDKTPEGYRLVNAYYNKTVPYRSFAWHFGAQREIHRTMPGDLTHYDAVHAEVMMVLDAAKNGRALDGKSLFIELLPCPTCARMLCETPIEEIVYSLDHSDGYAVKLFEKAGKTVRRLVDHPDIKSEEE